MRQPILSAVVVAMTASASAETIHETADPFGGPFGLWGMDVFVDQSVGARFTPDQNYTLDDVGIWFMNNSGTMHGEVRVTLQTDGSNRESDSVPSGDVLEEWVFEISALGWNPQLDVVTSSVHPLLEGGTHYWIVAESETAGGEDPVWNFASEGVGYTANTNFGSPWVGGSGAALAMLVTGTPSDAPCPTDLDDSGATDFGDVLIVLTSWGPCAACEADLDRDGVVGFTDLLAVLAAWGPC